MWRVKRIERDGARWRRGLVSGLGEDGGDGKKAPQCLPPPSTLQDSLLWSRWLEAPPTQTQICAKAVFFETWIKHLCKTTAFPLNDALRPKRVFPSCVVKSCWWIFHFFFFFFCTRCHRTVATFAEDSLLHEILLFESLRVECHVTLCARHVTRCQCSFSQICQIRFVVSSKFLCFYQANFLLTISVCKISRSV